MLGFVPRFISEFTFHTDMALKRSSSLITIGFKVDETALNTFTQGSIDLQLNPLDNEVFVVQAVNLDPSTPDAVPGANTTVACSLSTTSRPTVGNLSTADVIATANLNIRGFAASGVGFTRDSMETPPAELEYIAIISTNDFFVQIEGTANIGVKNVSGKMYGYRAKADAATYAALVQSELLSA